MITDVIKYEGKQRDIISFTPDQVDLIKNTIAKGASDNELKLFMYQAQKSGLDPLARQIYFQKRKNYKTGEDSVTITTGIDGYRLIADRTGKYAGNDDPVFDPTDGKQPQKATVTVYKMIDGQRCAFSASARWDQYYPGEKQGFMWNKMPHLMLGKCAEALALRKAFPAELSGLYTTEEMEQAAPKSEPKPVEKQLIVDGKPTEIPFGPEKKPAGGYTGSPEQQQIISELLKKQKIDSVFWDDIHKAMLGKPSTALQSVIEDVTNS